MPRYAFAGLALLAISEAGMLAHVMPFWQWHTPFAWTGYILAVDGYIYSKRGSSWLTANRREFLFLALVSIPLWLVFEAYNLLIHNWHYINLPANRTLRYFGYAWAFATIWPGIFETAELVALLRRKQFTTEHTESTEKIFFSVSSVPSVVSFLCGLGLLVWPLVDPSPYLSIPVWLGFILLLDPINERLGVDSLLGDWRAGRFDRLINLSLAGLLCGALWEFWNYWSLGKWIYTIPYLPEVKIFEMPLLGYGGFPAFALECFTMYLFVRRIFWRGATRPVGL